MLYTYRTTTALLLAASTFHLGAMASHLRSMTRHTEVTQALLQTQVFLNKKDCAPGDSSCASDASAVSTLEIQDPPGLAQDELSTMHGCKCADYWQFDGYTHKGCALVSDRLDQEITKPLCFVQDAAACKGGYAMAKLANVTGSTGICANSSCVAPSEGAWDFCARVDDISPYMTESSCHCSSQWEFQSKLYNGCSQTNADEPSWCYVAETKEGCAKAKDAAGNRTQRWDFCNAPDEKPAYLTRSGCHCKPTWEHNKKKYSTCLSQDEVAWPAELKQAMNSTIDNKNLLGWCQVFEDGSHCPASTTSDGFVVDVCFMADEATQNELHNTYNGCHCQPEWSLGNHTYQGCTKTNDGQEVTPWCPVVEDHSVCSQSLTPADASESGEGRGGWNWDYCNDGHEKNISAAEEAQHKRFVPAPGEDVPGWYENILDKWRN